MVLCLRCLKLVLIGMLVQQALTMWQLLVLLWIAQNNRRPSDRLQGGHTVLHLAAASHWHSPEVQMQLVQFAEVLPVLAVRHGADANTADTEGTNAPAVCTKQLLLSAGGDVASHAGSQQMRTVPVRQRSSLQHRAGSL